MKVAIKVYLLNAAILAVAFVLFLSMPAQYSDNSFENLTLWAMTAVFFLLGLINLSAGTIESISKRTGQTIKGEAMAITSAVLLGFSILLLVIVIVYNL